MLFSGLDETIVTPYAQLLSSLRSIRNNYFVVANLSPKKFYFQTLYFTLFNNPKEETKQRLALETLEEIEFCLDKVESMQTHPSAAQMAAHKFSQILNREMSQNPDLKNNGGGSITGYLKTFLGLTAAPQLTDDTSSNRNAKNKATNIFTRLISRENSSERAMNDEAVVNDVERLRLTRKLNMNIFLAQLIESTNDTWGVDLFEVDALSNHRPLTHVALHLFKQRNILKQFQIRELTFFKFISAIEAKYRNNPYHNNIHATDVLQASHHMLNFSVFKNVFTELEVFAALFAAAVHDVDHPGVTNQYLINTNSDLAILYNDESVLENHHVTLAFQTLSTEGCDVLSTLNRKQHQMFRKMVISVVLATDMSKHIQHIGHLKTMVEIRRLSSSASSIIDPENAEDKLQILQSLVHCSDLSNPLKPLNLYLQWTDRIMEEFFRQGDLEKSLNLEVSPLCDRENSNICKSQMGFIDYVVHPLWEIWSRLTQPDCQPIMDILESNRVWIASQVLTEDDKHDGDDDGDDDKDDDDGDDDVIRDDSNGSDDVKNAKRKDGS
ncbi:hypothetical protein HELRODRAFT_77130 [Helobdella robusta]|uniref:Phosphodiesterase n=1 Tax=Helobdella robusta TaxID=6412 RepID=T1G2T5_HELRO|nr:hypothetical protein HELRODRAFT_77130 [Helobdella robusta]ESO06780.1 hypothetical protein HELRODRAFT_77130 [Helobdella robusta]